MSASRRGASVARRGDLDEARADGVVLVRRVQRERHIEVAMHGRGGVGDLPSVLVGRRRREPEREIEEGADARVAD